MTRRNDTAMIRAQRQTINRIKKLLPSGSMDERLNYLLSLTAYVNNVPLENWSKYFPDIDFERNFDFYTDEQLEHISKEEVHKERILQDLRILNIERLIDNLSDKHQQITNYLKKPELQEYANIVESDPDNHEVMFVKVEKNKGVVEGYLINKDTNEVIGVYNPKNKNNKKVKP